MSWRRPLARFSAAECLYSTLFKCSLSFDLRGEKVSDFPASNLACGNELEGGNLEKAIVHDVIVSGAIGNGSWPVGSSDDHARSVQREHVDDVLVAFWEWLRIQEARWRDDADRQEFHSSPSIAAGEQLLDKFRGQATVRRPSVGRRVLRTFVYGIIFIVIVGTASTWSSSDDNSMETVKGWVNSLRWLPAILRNNAPTGSNVATKLASKTTDEATTQNPTHPQATLSIQPMPAASGIPVQLQHRLEDMANDIAVMQRTVEKLISRQELMAEDITQLQSNEQNVIQRLSPQERRPANQIPPRKNIPSVPSR
jgi:hypothetical protein